MKNLTVVTYHYVRNTEETPYPRIKACSLSTFEAQLQYFQKHFTPVTIEQCRDVLDHRSKDFPKDAILLTFDDGFVDHYREVFPRLRKAGVQGCFFPCGRSLVEHSVLDVHKIHFLLASFPKTDKLVTEIFTLLDRFRKVWSLPSNDILYKGFAQASMFDDPETTFIKRILQRELPSQVRSSIIDKLFQRFVTSKGSSFARSLYLNMDQLQEMQEGGMAIGTHGFSHEWLDHLAPGDQENDIIQAIRVLRQIGVRGGWVMSYPYGASNRSLISLLKQHNCTVAFTSKPTRAVLEYQWRYMLPRFDTNHFRSDDRKA